MISVEATMYGPEALDRLREVTAGLKQHDPMAPVTILVSNNIAGMVARRHLAAGIADGTSGVAGIEISTLPRLAERLAAHKMSPRRPATRTVNAAAWRRALSEAPGVFEEVADHPATIRALSSAHRELRDLTDSALATLSATTDLSGDLVRLHRRVTAQLEGDWYDETAVLDMAIETVHEHGFTSPVVLYLPQALTQAEAAFASALGETCELIVIAGLTGAQRADEAVHRTLSRLGVTTAEKPSISTASRIINASDSDDEVRCVVRDVLETLKNVPAHRVAVLYASSSPYSRLLHEHLNQAGVTVNGRGVRAVNERAVARTLLEVLALTDHDLPRADLFRALASAPTRDFDGTRIPISRWERTSRSAGVVNGDGWGQRLERFVADKLKEAAREDADGERPWLADRHRQAAETATHLSEFACTLRDSLRRAETMTSWRELGDWCLDLFSSLVGESPELLKLPEEEQYAASTVKSVLESVAGLDAVAGSASLKALRDVLDLELTASLPRVGKFGDGVLVAPISAAVGLDLDVLFLVGLSEDIYPGRLREDALLPESARDAVAEEMPTYRENLHAKYRHLLAAMASAGEVIASFPRGDLRRSSHRLPSRWLLSSMRELSGDHALAATEWEHADGYGDALFTSGSFAGELLSTSHLATEQEWRTRMAVAGQLDDKVVASAGAMISARRSSSFSRYDGDLSGLDGLPDYARDDKLVSPTALESYADCPHAFFIGRMLGVQPLEQPEDVVVISAMDIGNLVHECFDDLISELAGQLPGAGEPWSSEQRVRLVAIAEAKALEFQERGLTGHPTLWDGELRRILRDVIAMLDDDDKWRLTNNAEVKASELPFGIKGKAPVEIVIPSGRVLMRGSADKVDVGADGTIYVTDIKTGSRRTFKDISQDDPLVGGTKLQLPVYAYAARERFGDRATPVETAYWFVRRDPGRVGIDLTPDVEALYAETLDVLVRSIAGGLFPAKAPEAADFAWVQCHYCNPDGIGHSENWERWLRKRHDPALRDLVGLIDPAAFESEDQ